MTATLANASADDRRESDFYPTPPDVTVALLEWLDLPDPAHHTTIWEPACGDGAMSNVMRGYGFRVVASDIRTEGIDPLGTGGKDFLAFQPAGWRYNLEYVDPMPPTMWVITNPPFNLAEEFIRKALATTPNVAMLLKSQFWHAQSRAKLFGEHPPSAVLPLTWRPDFLAGEKGGAPTMDCLWTVWGGKRGAADWMHTRYEPLMRPSGARSLL